jgi:hypothetical protein
MKTLLIQVRPLDPITGNRVDVYLGTGPYSPAFGAGGITWEAAVTRRPTIMMDLMSPDMDGSVQQARASLGLNLSKVRNVPNVLRFVWAGAPIIIYVADRIRTFPVEFVGVVRQGQLDIFTQGVSLDCIVDRSRLERPLLTGEFTGGGGMGGDPAKKGTLYPSGFGVCKNIEPVWFEESRNIGMLDGYGRLTSVQSVFEGGNDMGPSVGDYATYALLAAALDNKTIPDGRWGTCIAQGIIGMGAPPAGRVTVHATFLGPTTNFNRLPGSTIYYALGRAGIPDADIDITSLVSLNNWAIADLPNDGYVHYWTKDQRTVLDFCQALAASCNASLLILPSGKIAVTRIFGGTSMGTVDRGRTSNPAYTDWRLADPIEPVWRMRARVARPGVVLSYDEVNYEDDLEDRGIYKTTETYRQGHLVWHASGAQFLYINAVPAAGQALPTPTYPPAAPAANAYWQQTKPPSSAADLVYSDGTSIEALKPQEAGSNKTETRTALAIAGQGTGATANNLGQLNATEGTKFGSIAFGATLGDNFFNNGSLINGLAPWTGGVRSAGGAGDPVPFYVTLGAGASISYPVNAAPPVGNLFFSAFVFQPVAGQQMQFGLQWQNSAGVQIALSVHNVYPVAGWSFVEYPVVKPADAVTFSAYVLIAAANGRVGGLRFSSSQAGATFGADINNVNLFDSFDGTFLTRTLVRTPLGTAAAIAGQGTGATANSLAQMNSSEGTKFAGISPGAGKTLNLFTRGGVVGTMSYDGNNITRATGGPGWNISGMAEENYGRGAIVGGNLGLLTVMGLCDNPDVRLVVGEEFRDVDYYWHRDGAGNYVTSLGGSSEINHGQLVQGGRCYVHYDDAEVHFVQQNTIIRSVPTTPNRRFWPMVCIFNNGGTVTNLQFAPGVARSDLATNIIDSASGVYSFVPRGEIRTPLGTALGIAGQGALATLNALGFGSGYLTGFGSLAGRNKINLGVPGDGTAYLADQTDSFVVTNAHAITSQGTAAGIAGQGTFATKSTADLESEITNKTRISRLGPNGQALGTFIDVTGRSFARLTLAGTARDGDSVSFGGALPSVPKIVFLPGGNAATAGRNIKIQAEGLSVTGFTMRAKEQAVVPGSTITDGSPYAGGAGNPTTVINRSNSGAPFDNTFRFNISFNVGNIAPGEPGNVEVILYMKRGGTWVAVQSDSSNGTANHTINVSGPADGSGAVFGMSIASAQGAGSTASLTSVSYTLGSVSETSLTPVGASDIPYLVLLQ